MLCKLKGNIYVQHIARASTVALLFEAIDQRKEQLTHPVEVREDLMEEMRFELFLKDWQEITK